MAPRTLASAWKQIEKYARHQLDPENRKPKDLDALDNLLVKVNDSKVVETIARMFIHRYAGTDKTAFRFATSVDGEFPHWVTSFDTTANVLRLNPVGVSAFIKSCAEAKDKLALPETRESFDRYRYEAYKSEMSKLTSQWILLLLLLCGVAAARGISHVERRDGELELSTSAEYMNLVWAFNELEAFYTRNTGLSMRTEFGILWHESEWVLGR